MGTTRTICFAAVILVLCSLALAAPSPRYIFTDLGTIPGAQPSEAVAINNRGEVLVNTEDGRSAFVWIPNKPNGTTGTFWDMGVIDPGETQWPELGTETISYDVNDRGEIVGVSGSAWRYRAARSSLPFKTTIGKKLDRSCAIRDRGVDVPYAINNRGVIVGAMEDASSSHAVKWGSNGNYVSLGKLAKDALVSFTWAGATDVNDAGTIVGYSEKRAWILTGMHKLDLGIGYASAINNRGVIAGEYKRRACIWVGRKRQQLDTRRYRGDTHQDDLGGSYSTANDINDMGQIVGSYDGSAALWDRGKIIDLETYTRIPADLTLISAKAINNKGQIVGSAIVGKGPNLRAFLLTPIELNR